METADKKPVGRPKAALTQYMVRPNYRHRPWWTPAEAADYAERGPTTVRHWMYHTNAVPCKGGNRMRFQIRPGRRCPDMIDRESFKRYIETGLPQGLTLAKFKKEREHLIRG